MATIYRALVTGLVLLWCYVIATGWSADASEADLAWHLRVGLVGSLFGVLIQCVPFAYFLGTGFWVKAFARAARAGDDWERRQKTWMKGRAYPAMYAAPFLTALVAVSGSLVETGRLAHVVHPVLVALALVAQIVSLCFVPGTMQRNSALMDELADAHHVPRPGTPEMDALVESEAAAALPPLFQLSRVALLFAFQCVLVWLYLRFGTERFRDAPLLPFALTTSILLTAGLGLNARYDPERPRPALLAWGRAIAIGVVTLGLAVWIRKLG